MCGGLIGVRAGARDVTTALETQMALREIFDCL